MRMGGMKWDNPFNTSDLVCPSQVKILKKNSQIFIKKFQIT